MRIPSLARNANTDGRRRARRGAAGPGRPGAATRVGLVVVLSALALAGCDEEFEPIAPSEIEYSIWGYLEATADTQWIRVMPIRDVAVTEPGPSAATVTLEHVGSGQVMPLQDSMFVFDLGGGGQLYAHNFWTGEPIEPGATYRFRAELPGETPAEAEIRIPARYEPELWVAQVSGTRSYLRLPDIKYVAYARESLQVDTETCVDRTVQPYDLPADSAADGESVMIPLATFHFPESCGTVTMSGGARVAASGGPWPSQLEYAPGVLGEADVLGTNISNSVGFVGGLLTETVRYQACRFVDPRTDGVPAHCRLSFGPGTAQVHGTVGSTCELLRIGDVLVTIQELEGEPAAARRMRPVRTSSAGQYEVLGLRPGRHAVTAEAPRVFGNQVYEVYTDTLELAAGDSIQLDLQLTPTDGCEGAP